MIRCPACPVCGAWPQYAMSPQQAICPAGDCPAITWDMTKTRNENLDETNFINIDDFRADGQPPAK